MSKIEMTPTPWNFSWDDNGFHFLWADENMPRPYICATGKSDPDDINEENVKAIVSAINHTYGFEINPTAVPAMLLALRSAQKALLHCGETGGQIDYDTLEEISAAIDWAKLP